MALDVAYIHTCIFYIHVNENLYKSQDFFIFIHFKITIGIIMLKIAALLFALLVIGSSAFDLNDLDNLNKKGKYVRIISHFK